MVSYRRPGSTVSCGCKSKSSSENIVANTGLLTIMFLFLFLDIVEDYAGFKGVPAPVVRCCHAGHMWPMCDLLLN